MPVECACPKCQKRYQVPEGTAGRTARCSACGQTFVATGTLISGSQPVVVPIPAPASATAVLPTLGRFVIRKRLGAGAFGTVYRAYDPQLDREVALKVPNPGVMTDAKRVERFLREAKAAANLRHPHIVPVFDAGRDGGNYYIASAFIAGKPLADTIPEDGDAFVRCAQVVRQLAEALAYAHEQGVVHRDVKPANMMVDDQDRVHLMDFGLASRQDDVSRLTNDGAVMGTPAYMSPEQARGQKGDAQPATDQYAAGVVLYELLTGRVPFGGPVAAVIAAVLTTDPDPPRKVRPDVPKDLETICLKAMSKAPGDRYADCRALADDLRRWLEGEPIAARQMSTRERAVRWVRRNPAVSGLACAVALALTVGLVTSTAFAARASRAATRAAAESEEAVLQRARAEAAAGEARRQRTGAEQAGRMEARRAAESQFLRALELCERGDVGHGLLWLARAKVTADKSGDAALARVVGWNLRAWEDEHPALEHALAHPGRVFSAAFSADGRLALTGCEDGLVRVWDADTGRPDGAPLKHPAGVIGIDTWPTGDRVVTTSQDGRLRVWDLRTRSVIAEAAASGPLNNDGRLHPACDPKDDNRVLVGSWGGAALYAADTGRPIHRLRRPPNEPTGPTEAVAFHPDGRIVTVDNGTRAQFWDATTFEPLGPPLVTALSGVRSTAVAVSPTGAVLATGQLFDHAVRFHTVRPAGANPAPGGGPFYMSGVHSARTHAVTFAAGGRLAASASEDATVKLWDVEAREQYGPTLIHGRSVRAVRFDPAGGRLITASDDGVGRVFRVHRSGPTHNILVGAFRHALGLAFSPDSKRLASAVGVVHRNLQVRDVETGRVVAEPRTMSGFATDLRFTPAGDRLVLAVGDSEHGNMLAEWDLTDAPPAVLLPRYSDQIWKVVLSPDGRRVGFGTYDYNPAPNGSQARLLEYARGAVKPIGGPLQHAGKVFAAAFRPDGAALLTGSFDRTSRLWDAATGKPLGPPKVHASEVCAVAFTPDGRHYLTGAADRTIQRWDAQTGAAVGPAMQHQGRLSSLEVTPDGRFVASASVDGTARFWDPDTGHRVGPPLRHARRFGVIAPTAHNGAHVPCPVTALALSPNGRWAATGGEDGYVKVWSVERIGSPATGTDVERLTGLTIDAQSAIRVLTAEEWAARPRRAP